MESKKDFYTFRGYHLRNREGQEALTPSMEDYLEMIYRLSKQTGYTRVLEVASSLNVQPPSASSMIQKLAGRNWVQYEKYRLIRLTAKGRNRGAYLLRRHRVLEKFLRFLGLRNVLEDTEKLEHHLSPAALAAIEKLLQFFDSQPDLHSHWESFR